MNNPPECEEKESLGVRLAAERRAKQELGLTMHHKELIPVSKLLYRSYGDGFFGESEFDHVLFGFL